MDRLPTQRRESLGGCDVHLVHGSPLALNDFWWESLPEDEHRARVAASGAQVICCTHSGLPWQRRVDGTLVVNVGVLGKPANDGRREVWYALLDLEDGHAQAQLIRLAYDWAAQAASMRAAQLPEPFVETIETGWWTTCLESLPPAERSRGRYHLYRSLTPTGFAPAAGGWGDDRPPTTADDDGGRSSRCSDRRTSRPGYGSTRTFTATWPATTAPSPHHRRPTPERWRCRRFVRLVDEAQAEGFTELYLTGGEPLMHPDLSAMLHYAADRLPTVLLTNAMLLRGRRLDDFARLASHPNLTVQTSLDGARAATHDAHRGRGSFAATMSGIETPAGPRGRAQGGPDRNAGEQHRDPRRTPTCSPVSGCRMTHSRSGRCCAADCPATGSTSAPRPRFPS